MTIRSVANIYRMGSVPIEANRTSSRRSGIAFVLNKDFIPGLKVLIYSMIKSSTLLDLPVVILSEDDAVLRDEFIIGLADVRRHVTDVDISEFAEISSGQVAPQAKLDWIPKYSYLKWLIYDNYGFDQLIWLDVDTICVAPLDGLLEFNDADLYAAPVFQKSLRESARNEPLPLSESSAKIVEWVKNGYLDAPSLNSGVMVLNKPVLSESFRNGLVSWNLTHEVPTEQRAVYNFLEVSNKYRRGYLSPLYNFHHSYYRYMDDKDKQWLWKNVKLLHFIGSAANPWRVTKDNATSTQKMWWDLADELDPMCPVF